MLAQEIIRAKRDGQALNEAQINHFVRGLVDNSWSEGQVAALAMAIFMRGMGHGECVALTHAMMQSGRVMTWPDMPGPVLDKHSSGGVGDKVSIVLAPLVSSLGVAVPMMSGRGLGHTGGTLDKLESIPGFETFENTWSERAPLGWDETDQGPTARAVCALMSDFFPATTGEIVHVDGGYHAMGA